MIIEVPYHEKGNQPQQEDCYHIEEFCDGGFLVAVADGFWQRNENVSVSGKVVSSLVIEIIKERITGREPATVSTFQAIDRHVSRQTENCIAGSTLALVYRQSVNDKLIFFTRGDCFIVSRPRGGGLEVYPVLALKRQRAEVWSCYGDVGNRDSHPMPAEIRHPQFESQMILVASRGFFPQQRPFGSSREFALVNTATRYMNMLSAGKSLTDIAKEAKFRGAIENLTAIAIKL